MVLDIVYSSFIKKKRKAKPKTCNIFFFNYILCKLYSKYLSIVQQEHKLAKLAAEGGDTGAYSNIGFIYSHGFGVTQSSEKAFILKLLLIKVI